MPQRADANASTPHLVAAGCVTDSAARLWARSDRPGPHTLVLRRRDAPDQAESTVDIQLDANRGNTGAVQVSAGIGPGELHDVQLRRDGEVLAKAQFRAPPRSGEQAPRRWSFAAFSCHQPFAENGSVVAASASMLEAACSAIRDSERPFAFALMMGDQLYADAPSHESLYDDAYFQRIAPPGRRTLLECSREEVRKIFHARYERFWGVRGFADLQSLCASYPMPDDHEVIDNYGTHPDHDSEDWQRVRDGALDAFFDYQGVRVHNVDARPEHLDYGFRWGPAAVYGMDIRTNRRTVEGTTHVFSDAQIAGFRGFLEEHASAELLVLMLPIPLVHVEAGMVNALARMLSPGSDLHERWSHEQCTAERDRLVGMLHSHALAHPRQRLLLLGGDVHSGCAYQVDFEDGVQLLQLTSSPLSNEEGSLSARVGERAAKSVSTLPCPGTSAGRVHMLDGQPGADRNPFGGLNIGFVDVTSHGPGEPVGVSLRLVSHDGAGRPVTVLDTGEIGRRTDPARRLTGIADGVG